MKELWRLPARQVVGLLKRRKVSPLELIDADSLAAVHDHLGQRIVPSGAR